MVFRKIPCRFAVERVKKSATRYIVNELPKTFNDAVYPQLPFLIRQKQYRIRTRVNNNPGGQLYALTGPFTDLIRDERIVLGYNRATELRPHVERVIVEAMRNGDRHRPTMELANFWLREKNLIHKLFKVIVPRYENYASSFTAMHLLGRDYEKWAAPLTDYLEGKVHHHVRGEVVLEMKDNGLPRILRPQSNRAGLLTNVLMNSARHNSATSDTAKPQVEQQTTPPRDEKVVEQQ